MRLKDRVIIVTGGAGAGIGQSSARRFAEEGARIVLSDAHEGRAHSVAAAIAEDYGVETIGIRPEHVTLSTTEGTWTGTVKVAEHLGSDTFLHVESPIHHEPLTVRAGGEFPVHHGDTVYLTPQEDKLHRFDGQGLAVR